MQIVRTFPVKLVLIATLVALLMAAGACRATPTPTRQSTAVQQNMPPTPKFDTTRVQPNPQFSPVSPLPTPANGCPGLDSALAQIIASRDPLAEARQRQLTIKDGKIQVVLLLNQEDTRFLQSFDVEVGSRAGMQVQVFAPPARLCDLIKTGKVLAVNLPNQGIPQ